MTDINNEALPVVNAVARVQGCDAGTVQVDPRQERIDELAKELARTPEAVRKERFMKRFHAGRLTFEDYKTLPEDVKRLYAKLHGVPLAANELQRQANEKNRRKEKNKCAKKSRRRNRK